MKKFLKVILFTTVILTLCACGKKESLSQDEISSSLISQGFDVYDVSEQMEDSNVKKVLAANNGKYQIEYYSFAKDKYAKDAYESNKDTFNKASSKKGKEKSNENYNKYTQELSDTYNCLIRIDNTLVYLSVNIEYKSSAKKVLKNLGYY